MYGMSRATIAVSRQKRSEVNHVAIFPVAFPLYAPLSKAIVDSAPIMFYNGQQNERIRDSLKQDSWAYNWATTYGAVSIYL